MREFESKKKNQHIRFYEQLKFHAHLSKFYNLGAFFQIISDWRRMNPQDG